LAVERFFHRPATQPGGQAQVIQGRWTALGAGQSHPWFGEATNCTVSRY
jgi:hypothetical protein